MPLATRIIPSLLVKGGMLVKGRQFNSWRVVGHPLQAARIHGSRGVDELIILDIGATPAGRGPDLKMVESLCDSGFTPITVGGGVRSVQDVYDLLRAGADKVAIGTAAFDDRYLLNDITKRFGSQCLVLALDYRHGRIVTNCGTRAHDTRPGMGVVTQAIAAAQLGVGEILLTCVEREGTMEGYDLVMIKAVSEAVDIPVVAHGGAGTYQHMLEAVQHGASAVAAGAMFQFTEQTPEGAAQYLAAHGVTTRTKEEA